MKDNKVGAGMCMILAFIGAFLAATSVIEGNVPMFAYGVLNLGVSFFAASMIENEPMSQGCEYV